MRKAFWISVLACVSLLAVAEAGKEKDEKKHRNIRIDAEEVLAPPFIKVEEGRPVMQFAVLNRTSLISPAVLGKVLRAITKQVNEDFSPFYGIRARFQVFANELEVDWTQHAALIITDTLLQDCSCISFHAMEDSNLNGVLIETQITNPPDLPIGTPFIIIPMGDATTDFGIVPASLLGDPTLPPTFEGIFSFTVSHEVLDTLHNYTTNLATLNFEGNLDFVDAFFNEVCDPVENAPGYRIDGISVSNFVLPSYWINDLATGPFDFQLTVPAPLTPFAGTQTFIQFGPCGGELLELVSVPQPFGDPFTIFVNDLGPAFAPCPCPTGTSGALGEPIAMPDWCGPHPKLRVHKRVDP